VVEDPFDIALNRSHGIYEIAIQITEDCGHRLQVKKQARGTGEGFYVPGLAPRPEWTQAV
jgi:hypothetical protein